MQRKIREFVCGVWYSFIHSVGRLWLGIAEIPREQFPRSILVASLWTRPIRATSSRRRYELSGVSGDFSVQLATRLPIIGRSTVCCSIVLPVCPCVVSFSKFCEYDTHNLLRISIAINLVRHIRHARFPRDMLATSSVWCHATRKVLPWNFSLFKRAPRRVIKRFAL